MTSAEWRPNARQREALACGAYELLYGGQAGGGKSDYLLVAPLRWVHVPGSRAILFRRSYPELERTLIARSHELYPQLGATYHAGRREWTWPGGGVVGFGYLEADADALRYQGAEFSFVGFDELTHFTEASYRYLSSRLRSSRGVPVRLRATANPGGPGHEWVRSRWGAWIGRGSTARDGERRWYDPRGAECAEDEADALARTFVRATLGDNPYLGREYRAQLLALDPVTRAQLLDGDWDAAAGDGGLFHRDWWAVLDRAPDTLRRVRAWDLGAGGDLTAGVLLGDRGPAVAPRWVVLDVVTHRGPPHEVHRLIASTAAQDGRAVTVVVPQDPGQAGVDQARGYQRELAGYDVRTRRPTGDKVTRARPWSAQVGARNAALVRGPWVAGFVGEHHAFPDGPHDDQVDAAADAFAVLAGGAGAGDGGIFAAVAPSRPRTVFDLHPDDEDS